MRRLGVVAGAMVVGTACGVSFDVRHPDRVHVGEVLTAINRRRRNGTVGRAAPGIPESGAAVIGADQSARNVPSWSWVALSYAANPHSAPRRRPPVSSGQMCMPPQMRL
jgi:hypothetical protein